MNSLNYDSNKYLPNSPAKPKRSKSYSSGKSGSNDKYQEFLEFLDNSSYADSLKKQILVVKAFDSNAAKTQRRQAT